MRTAGGGSSSGTIHCTEPLACTEEERQRFARLVRQGFAGTSADLDSRIRSAHCLAFYYNDSTLGGIAALKGPPAQYCANVFTQAEAPQQSAEYRMELGWVFVAPGHRGEGVAERLCRALMARVPGTGVFATTRPDNVAMMTILRALGFARVGVPYLRHDEELALFVRPGPLHTRL